MESVCQMDCHACSLQEGIENKSLCATLLIPAMINRLSIQINELLAIEKTPAAIKEVKLTKKQIENENRRINTESISDIEIK